MTCPNPASHTPSIIKHIPSFDDHAAVSRNRCPAHAINEGHSKGRHPKSNMPKTIYLSSRPTMQASVDLLLGSMPK